MNYKWKLIGRGLLLGFLGFCGLALFAVCLSRLSSGRNSTGFLFLGVAALVLFTFIRLATPHLNRPAALARFLSWLGLGLIAAGLGAWQSAIHVQYADSIDQGPATARPARPNMMPMALALKGVSQPILTPASQVRLAPNEWMIGVVAFGKAQAYLRRSLAQGDFAAHVVNDLFGTNPVTVTYCDKTDRTRVFTANQATALDIGCGGWHPDQELALLVGDKNYSQAARDIPLADVPFVITTWKAWREQYPDSEVYVGIEGPAELAGFVEVKERWLIGLVLIALGFGAWAKGQRAPDFTADS